LDKDLKTIQRQYFTVNTTTTWSVLQPCDATRNHAHPFCSCP